MCSTEIAYGVRCAVLRSRMVGPGGTRERGGDPAAGAYPIRAYAYQTYPILACVYPIPLCA
eukprot:1333072-Rhodomonas_salina.1